jgi:4'-phosphopantetheinyl transferase EntD
MQITTLPGDARLLIGRIHDLAEPLMPEELVMEAGVTPARLEELRAGRSAARKAMMSLGLAPTPILAGSGGEPVWPAGISGSLAHTTQYVAALVARTSNHASVGVDLNDMRPLGAPLTKKVASSTELAAAMVHLQLTVEDTANVLFSAKEAFFKYQHPLTSIDDLEFSDVSLVPAERSRTFALRCPVVQRRLSINVNALVFTRAFVEWNKDYIITWVLNL